MSNVSTIFLQITISTPSTHRVYTWFMTTLTIKWSNIWREIANPNCILQLISEILLKISLFCTSLCKYNSFYVYIIDHPIMDKFWNFMLCKLVTNSNCLTIIFACHGENLSSSTTQWRLGFGNWPG